MKLLVSILFLSFVSLWGQTEVSGSQYGTWDIAGSPYVLTGDVTIPAGESLVIQQGVKVMTSGHYKISIYGEVAANGTESQNILFTGNEATNGPWGGIEIINSSAPHVFAYCRFENGQTYSNSEDVHGGAILLKGSDATFTHCTFADNSAIGDNDGMGGAVYGINLNNTVFSDCVFTGNYAYGSGGAVRLSAADNTIFKDCVFLDNHCKYGGGAISFGGVSGTLLLRCLFANNYTEYSSGGAIHTIGPVSNYLTFEHCTITGNSASSGDGGAVELAYAIASFTNCIIWDNQGAYSDGIYLDMDGSATINFCDLQMPDGATGSDNINLNPLFINPGEGDYRLQYGSPCIDTGTYLGYNYIGDAPDMGCYEFGMIGIETSESINIRIYPNPASDYLSIEGAEHPVDILLYDSTGKLVEKLQNVSGVPLNRLAPGWYELYIESPQRKYHKRLLIE